MGLTDKFAGAISEQRAALGWTQPQAARFVGVSLRTWQDWEAGNAFPQKRHRPAVDGFMALAPTLEPAA